MHYIHNPKCSLDCVSCTQLVDSTSSSIISHNFVIPPLLLLKLKVITINVIIFSLISLTSVNVVGISELSCCSTAKNCGSVFNFSIVDR